MAIKLIFALMSLAILLPLLIFIPKFHSNWIIYIYAFGMVLGNIMFPVWFFQGMERMKYITVLNITAKTLFTVSIFFFIKSSANYEYVPLLNSLGFIVAGVLSLWIIFKNFGIKLAIPSLVDIKYQLVEGWHVFISTVAVSLYTTSNSFILGIFTNNTVVGYYAAAEKLIGAAIGLLNPIAQTAYPYISKLAVESKETALSFIKTLVKFVGIGSFLISLLIFVLATPIVNIILGSQYQQSIIILRILAFLPFIIGLAAVYATLFLLGFGYIKEWSRIIIICSLFDIAFVLIFVGLFSLAHIGVSISWLLTEIFVLLLSYLSYKKILHGYR